MRQLGMMWEKCQILVPFPISHPSSTIELGCTKYESLMLLAELINTLNYIHHFHAFKGIGRDGVISFQGIDYILEDIVMIGRTSLKGAIIIGRIGFRKLGHHIILNMTILNFIHI